jgi:hypothetical protein
VTGREILCSGQNITLDTYGTVMRKKTEHDKLEDGVDSNLLMSNLQRMVTIPTKLNTNHQTSKSQTT